MNKHEPVTDMTFGQLYDAVASGGEFYCEGEKVILDEYGHLTAPPLLQTGLLGALIAGQITRLVEVNWTDQLDGTWENGVWCVCYEDHYDPIVAKIENYHEKLDKPFQSNVVVCQKAKPLPQHLADQLEALSKEK